MTDSKTDIDMSAQEIQDAIMIALEAKFTAFMTRANMIDIEPADRAALRAAFFLGVASGMQMSNIMTGEEQADKKEDPESTDARLQE